MSRLELLLGRDSPYLAIIGVTLFSVMEVSNRKLRVIVTSKDEGEERE